MINDTENSQFSLLNTQQQKQLRKMLEWDIAQSGLYKGNVNTGIEAKDLFAKKSNVVKKLN